MFPIFLNSASFFSPRTHSVAATFLEPFFFSTVFGAGAQLGHDMCVGLKLTK